MTIPELIRQVAADGRVTATEWDWELEPATYPLPKTASADARAILELWASDSLEVDTLARYEMRSFLRSRGYDVPDGLSPRPALVEDIVRSNVSEDDLDFARLSELAGRTETTTTVGVFDGGTDFHHPALEHRFWTNPDEIAGNGLDDDGDGLVDDLHGWDFADGDAGVDSDQHGAHVGGLATQGSERLRLLPCRVFGFAMRARDLADAIDYAASKGARVINMSFNVELEENVAIVVAAMNRHPDVLFCAAAGNRGSRLGESGFDGRRYLAAVQLPNFMSVAAADHDGGLAHYSNYGAPYATVGALGSQVLSTVPGHAYGTLDGTSQACPQVSAIAAKVMALAPHLAAPAVKQLIRDTCDLRADWTDMVASGGLVSSKRATRLAALGSLVHDGASAEEAADRLELEGVERRRLLDLLSALP